MTVSDLAPGDAHVLAELLALHAEVDEQVRGVLDEVGERLKCRRGCSDCCQDELTLLPVEALRIRVRHRALLTRGTPHPRGACAFLDEEGACRI